MSQHGSSVVQLMEAGRDAAWDAWWEHVTRADREAAGYDAAESQLWRAFEEAAESCHLEIAARAVYGTVDHRARAV